MMNQKLSVSELNQQLKQTVEQRFFSVWVEGELSNISQPASGHLYFSLKDARSQMRCVMWRSSLSRMQYQPRVGDKVEIRGEISLYAPRGDLQLIAGRMGPAGQGDLLAQMQALKLQLQQEGLFAVEHKKPLPKDVSRIILITSESGAAIHDMLRVLERRAPHIDILVLPAKVQGQGSAEELTLALRKADALGWADVIIIGRGGGSIEDLWSFNDEQLLRAAFACVTPIVSAVGHESDTTLIDFVADVRAPTPSAAAEITSPDLLQQRRVLSGMLPRLTSVMSRRIHDMSQGLDHKYSALHQAQQSSLKSAQHRLQLLQVKHPLSHLQQVRTRIFQLAAQLERVQRRYLNEQKQNVSHYMNDLEKFTPDFFCSDRRKMIENATQQLRRELKSLIQVKKSDFSLQVQRLDDVSPLTVLRRGYSITTDKQGQLLRSIEKIESGAILVTRFEDGVVESCVQNKQEI